MLHLSWSLDLLDTQYVSWFTHNPVTVAYEVSGKYRRTARNRIDRSFRNTLLLFSSQLLQRCSIMKDGHMYPVPLDYIYLNQSAWSLFLLSSAGICSADRTYEISFTVLSQFSLNCFCIISHKEWVPLLIKQA